jgi:hypothetical protein
MCIMHVRFEQTYRVYFVGIVQDGPHDCNDAAGAAVAAATTSEGAGNAVADAAVADDWDPGSDIALLNVLSHALIVAVIVESFAVHW